MFEYVTVNESSTRANACGCGRPHVVRPCSCVCVWELYCCACFFSYVFVHSNTCLVSFNILVSLQITHFKTKCLKVCVYIYNFGLCVVL